jgi:hypothetical protein
MIEDGDTIVTTKGGLLSVYSMSARSRIRQIVQHGYIMDLAVMGDSNVLLYLSDGMIVKIDIEGRETTVLFAGGLGVGGFALKGRRLVFGNGSGLVVASGENLKQHTVLNSRDEDSEREYELTGLADDLVVGASTFGRIDLFDFN